MKESQIVATDRLRREDRWDEATLYRDQARRQLRSEGKAKAEARETSWNMMLEKFPPMESMEEESPGPSAGQPSESDLEDVDFDALLEKFGQNSPDFARDVFWVYHNLSNHGVAPEDAPGLGAWNMLNWARGAKNRFFEQVLPKVQAEKAKQDKDKEVVFDPSLERCEELLAEVEKEMELNCPKCGTRVL